MSTSKIRKLKQADSESIKCQAWDCTSNAVYCDTVEWNTGNTTGTSFFYFCSDHIQKQKDQQRKK